MKTSETPESVSLALEELNAGLVGLYGERLAGVYLCSSYARGYLAEDSDIDVFIALKGEVKPGAEIAQLISFISEICLRYDVLIATYPVPATWVRERQSPLFINASHEGVPIGKFLERTNHA